MKKVGKLSIYDDITQKSPEWLKLRENKVTCTGIHSLLNKGFEATIKNNKPSKYGNWTSPSMKRGNDLEPFARMMFEKKMGLPVEEVGFLVNDDYPNLGYSPDGVHFTGDPEMPVDYLIEIKCFMFKHHEQVLKEIDESIICQIQGGLLVTGAPYGFFVAYNPDYMDETKTDDGKRHPEKALYIKKIYSSEKYHDAIRKKLK